MSKRSAVITARATFRHGLTLVELVIGAAIATIITSAAFTMLFAASRASTQVDDQLDTNRRASFVLRRSGSWLRSARSFNRDSATKVTAWAVDDYPAAGIGGLPGDDQPEVSEMEELAYDATSQELRWRGIRFQGATPAEVQAWNVVVTMPGIGGSPTIDSLVASRSQLLPYVVTQVWAKGVTSCSFQSHVDANAQPNGLTITLTLAAGTSTQTYQHEVSLVAPAYYLVSTNTMDGLSSARKRRTAVGAW